MKLVISIDLSCSKHYQWSFCKQQNNLLVKKYQKLFSSFCLRMVKFNRSNSDFIHFKLGFNFIRKEIRNIHIDSHILAL